MYSFPPAFAASVVEWCPTMNVLAAGSDRGPVVLIRGATGRQIWLVPGRKNIAVRGIHFSRDGQLLAVRYEGGTFLVLQTSSGRTVSAGAGPASCLDWPEPQPRAPIDDDAGSLMTPFETAMPQTLVQGSPLGKLKLTLLGNLSMREMVVGTGAVTQIANENQIWAVICGEEVVVLHCAEIEETVKTGAIRVADTVRAVDQIKTALKRYRDFSKSFEDNMNRFFEGLEAPDNLFAYFLAGSHSKQVEEWLLHQHESGFRRWFKAVNTNLEDMRKQIATIVAPNSKAVLILCSKMLTLHNDFARGFGMIDAAQDFNLQSQLLLSYVIKLQRDVSALAAVLESVLSREIDRVLNITSSDDCSIGCACAYFKSDPQPEIDIEPLANLVTATWQNVLDTLEKTVQEAQRFPIVGTAIDLGVTDQCVYALTDSKLYVAGSASVSEFNIPGGLAILNGLVVAADHQDLKFYKQDQLVKTISLDIEPSYVAAKADAICVLQKDMVSFDIVGLD